MSYTIGQIAALLGLEYRGDGSRALNRVAKWDAADESSLVFLQETESKALHFDNLRAACVIAPKELAPDGSV